MKSKVQHQVQPRQNVPPRQGRVLFSEKKVQAEEEIDKFLQALNSYPARVAKEPGISFQEHLRSLSAIRDLRTVARDYTRPRRQ
jgi:hypothetical protein